MKDFLTSFMARHRNVTAQQGSEWKSAFEGIIALIDEVLGRSAFRPEGRLNTAVYDAVMVGIAYAQEAARLPQGDALEQAYNKLLANDDFVSATTSRTSHQPNVARRLGLARETFSATHADQ